MSAIEGMTFDWEPTGFNGKLTITARMAGDVVDCEAIDVTSEHDRAAYCRRLGQKFPGISPQTVENKLLAIAPDASRKKSIERLELFRPFPVDALPEPARGFVTAGAAAFGCDPSFVALPLLTVFAAAIGNTRRLALKRGWFATPILWTAVVGESGTLKTPAFKLAMKALREHERRALERHAVAMKAYEVELAKWDKAMTAWKREKKTDSDPPERPEPPQDERFIVSDTTVEALAPILLSNPRGVLLGRDELAGWIGSFDRYSGGKGADSAHWLSMHGGESLQVDRKTGTPRRIFVPHASVCITGGIQPGILRRALGPEHRDSGLGARLLLACPTRKPKRWTEADIDPEHETAIAVVLERLLALEATRDDEGQLRPVLVRLTPDAKREWIAYYNAHGQEQMDLSGELSAAWSKLEEYAARLALVIHFVRWAAHDRALASVEQVDLESMRAAVALTTWFKHEARRVYALLSESDEQAELRRLVEWIERRGGTVTPRDVQMGNRAFREAEVAEAALSELVKAGSGSWEPTPAGQPGRPTRRFKLKCDVVNVNETHESQAEIASFVDVDSVDAPKTQATEAEWGEV